MDCHLGLSDTNDRIAVESLGASARRELGNSVAKCYWLIPSAL